MIVYLYSLYSIFHIFLWVWAKTLYSYHQKNRTMELHPPEDWIPGGEVKELNSAQIPRVFQHGKRMDSGQIIIFH